MPEEVTFVSTFSMGRRCMHASFPCASCKGRRESWGEKKEYRHFRHEVRFVGVNGNTTPLERLNFPLHEWGEEN